MQQKLIQYNFNASSSDYLKHARIQKIPALKIIHKLPAYHISGLILDLGSGPGTLLHCPESSYQSILYDLSHKMLKVGVSMYHEKVLAINGDAGYLPFATGSISTVISNLMLQWAEDKLQVLSEIKRVLIPGGVFMFATLISPSLWQLQQAWNKLDKLAHTLGFLSYEKYTDIVLQSGLEIIHIETWESTLNFTDIYALMKHFKLTGTSMPKSNMGNSLKGKKLFKDLEASYPKNLSDGSLPLSYQYLFIIAKAIVIPA